MSTAVHLPFDIQAEILKRVNELRSLLRFRAISNAWKSLIDSPKFIADHHDTDQRQRHLLIHHGDYISEQKYVSVVDNNSFPQDQYCLTPPPDRSRIYFVQSFLGSSHGLLCYYGHEYTGGKIAGDVDKDGDNDAGDADDGDDVDAGDADHNGDGDADHDGDGDADDDDNCDADNDNCDAGDVDNDDVDSDDRDAGDADHDGDGDVDDDDNGDAVHDQEDGDGDDDPTDDKWTMVVVLWNPSIRRSVRIVMPKVLHSKKRVAHVGFGVCPGTTDPKFVQIITSRDGNAIPWQVEVCALSSGVWRSPLCTKLPHKSISLSWHPVVINGIIYWLATSEKRISVDEDATPDLIIAFDLTMEEFVEIYLPENLVEEDAFLVLANLRGSLALVDCNQLEETSYCGVMVMNHGGVPKSFTKLYSVVMAGPNYLRFCEFRKNGDPILKSVDADSEISTLKLYEPCSKRFTDLGFSKVDRLELPYLSPFVISYTETLLLLDNPDSISIQE